MEAYLISSENKYLLVDEDTWKWIHSKEELVPKHIRKKYLKGDEISEYDKNSLTFLYDKALGAPAISFSHWLFGKRKMYFNTINDLITFVSICNIGIIDELKVDE